MILLKYYMKFNSDWLDVTGMVNSSSKSPLNINLCSSSWKSTKNTASFSLIWRGEGTPLYKTIAEKLVQAQEAHTKVKCKITGASGEQLFFGFVNLNKITFTSAKIPQNIDISADDESILLDEKIKLNKIFDGASVKTIIDWLMVKSGLSEIYRWSDSLKDKVPTVPFVITSDDDYTYRDRLDTLLQEMGGYVLYAIPSEGKFGVRKINEDVAEGATIKTVTYRVNDRLKSESSRFSNDGVVVSFGNVKTSSNRLLYMHNINLSDGTVKDPNASVNLSTGARDTSGDGTVKCAVGDVVAVNGYFPLESDISKTFLEYDASLLDSAYNKKERRTQNSAMGLYYVKPESISMTIKAGFKDDTDAGTWYENKAFYSEEGRFTYPSNVEDINPDGTCDGEWYPRKAWQILHNKSGKIVNVKYLGINGIAIYKDKDMKVVMPPACSDPFEYTASYLSTEDEVKTFAEFLMNIKKRGGNTSTWTAPWGDHALGDHVYVEHKSMGKVLGVIAKKTLKVIGTEVWAEYIALSLGGWEEAEEYSSDTTSESRGVVSDYDKWLADGNVGTRADYESTKSSYFEYMWSSSPDHVDADARIFRFTGRNILVSGKPIGNFTAQDWSTVIEAKTDAAPYLWCRINGGTPFRVTGIDGDTIVTSVQYYISTSSNIPIGGSWGASTEEWTYGKYIWSRIYEVNNTTGDESFKDEKYEETLTNQYRSRLKWAFSPDPSTFSVNRRNISGYTDIKIETDIRYYGNVTPVFRMNGTQFVGSPRIYNYEANDVVIRMSHPTESSIYYDFTVKRVDSTGDCIKLAPVNTSADLPSKTESNEALIVGDYAIVKYVGGDFKPTPYVVKSVTNAGVPTWEATNESSIMVNTTEDVVALAKAEKDNGADINYTEALYAYEAYITRLSVGVLYVGTMFGNDIQSSNYKAGESGYKLTASKGSLEAVDADLSGSISVDHAYVMKGVFRRDRFYPEWF